MRLLILGLALALMAQGCGKAQSGADAATSSSMPSTISTDAQ